MKILVSAVFLTALASAQVSPGIFQETTFSAGEIEKGAKVRHTFAFTNHGKAPLEVKSVTPT